MIRLDVTIYRSSQADPCVVVNNNNECGDGNIRTAMTIFLFDVQEIITTSYKIAVRLCISVHSVSFNSILCIK